MPDSRDRILARIREALQAPAPRRHLQTHGPAAPADGSAKSPEAWLPPVPADREGRVALFAKNSADLKTEFVRCANHAEVRARLDALAAGAGWRRVAAHRFAAGEDAINSLGLPVTWTDSGYTVPDIESADAAITGCDCLVAQTGSVLVTSRSAGGRVLSVLPPHHVILATRDQIVGDISDAYAAVRRNHGGEAPAFLSFITGPSRTGDIERILVLGAHGPKRLTILLSDES
ncbi:MAG: LUD domain-containing protein [Terrimicrobiaceae bacterium]|nr:LUD domain-containing protein [Terrimicrobiaceae bacterium]